MAPGAPGTGASVRARAGALPPRAARRVGGPPQWVEESEKRGWPERGRVGRAAPRLPHHTRPSAPPAPPPGDNTVPLVWPPETIPARNHAASPATVVVISRRVSPAQPPRHVPRFGSEASGGGPSLRPTHASVSSAGHAPLFATAPRAEPPVRLGMGGVAVVAPRGAARPPIAFLPPALDRFPPRRRSSAPGPPPPRRAPLPVLRARGLSSVVRLALSRSLSFPPSPVCPLPARPHASRRSLPYAVGGEKGARDAGAGQGPPGWGEVGVKEKRGPRPGASGRSPPGFGDMMGASSGGGCGVSCGGRPGSRLGPRVTGW